MKQKHKVNLTLTQHRILQWMGILVVVIGGGWWYYQVYVRAAATIGTVADSGATFQADLKNTLALQHGVGAPTFTRADGADRRATVTDFEGLIKPVKENEARFEGARRVENLIPTSSASLAAASNKTVTVTAGTYVFSMGAGASSGVATFSGTGGATGTITQNASKRTSKEFTLTAGTFIVTASVATLVDLQFQQTTGQAISTIPSEYVSVGVLSAPYHGANIDGVKYFATQNGNTVATNVVTEATGADIPDATLHGYVAEGARTNLALRSETLGTSWTASNITVANNSVVAPSGTTTAETLTATAGNATLFQSIKGSAASYTFSVWLKRLTGTGTVSISADGTNFTTCTINSSTWTRCTDTRTLTAEDYNQTIKIVTNADAVYAWGAQAELGAFASSYIPTTTAAVTREGDALSYPTSGNHSDTAGSAYGEVMAKSWANVAGQYLGDGTEAPLQSSSSNSGIQSYDGTNTANGPTGTPTGQKKVASSWTGTTLKAFSGGTKGTDGTYDGAFSLAQLNIGSSFYGTIRNVKIWKKALTDAQITNMTSATANPIATTTVNASLNTLDTNGLVGLWSFDGPDVSGTMAYDRSGNNNNGTIVGGVSVTPGKAGQALNFNGLDGYVNSGDPVDGSLDFGTGSFSYGFWLFQTGAYSNWQDLLSKGGGSNDAAGYMIELDSSGALVSSISDGVLVKVTNIYSSNTPLNKWVHVFAVVDRTSNLVKTYVNGSPTAYTTDISTTNSVSTTQSFRIGSSFSGVPAWFSSAKIDDVRIYNTALTATQVNQLYMLARSPWVCGNDTIADIDGNIYGTVKIGTQCWMAQNTMTTKYPNGTSITRGPTGATWSGADNAYYAYPPNIGNTAEETLVNIQTNKLGFVYQWSAAMAGSTTEGAQGICPTGWHVPTDAQQYILENYLKNYGETCDANRNAAFDCSTAGTKLSIGGTSGFNAPLAGYRFTTGAFYGRGSNAYLWSSSQVGGTAWTRSLYSGGATVYRSPHSKAYGFSLRCLKD